MQSSLSSRRSSPRRAHCLQALVKCLASSPLDRSDEGSISILGRRRRSLGVYRFSEREQLPGKYLFTHGSNPQNKRYEDYPPSVWEKSPGPPNDNEIAKQYLNQAGIDRGSDSDSSILTGKFSAQRALMSMLHNALLTNFRFSESGYSMSNMRAFRMNTIK